MRYAIVIEHAGANYSAYVPDLPGCVATGATPEEARANIQDAVRFHLEGLREDGLPVPPPAAVAAYVEAEAA
ncbi:MAG: type II toxin-antitoxin system HicB family antitoxin [Phycisphaerales bacterium]